MNFHRPSDDIFEALLYKSDELKINKSLVHIGYRSVYWVLSSEIKDVSFTEFTKLLKNEDIDFENDDFAIEICYDSIAYIKYIDIDLWNAQTRIDRLFMSGDTDSDDSWNNISLIYTEYYYLNKKQNNESKTDESTDNLQKQKVILSVSTKFKGQEDLRRYNRGGIWYYNYSRKSYYNIQRIMNDKCYEIECQNSNKKRRIDIKNALKSQYKLVSCYWDHSAFNYLSQKQLSNDMYRMYDTMSINITNETRLHAMHRLSHNSVLDFKNVCVFCFGDNDHDLCHKTTLNHSISKYANAFETQLVSYVNSNDAFTEKKSNYLYSHNIVYSPNVLVLCDGNGQLTEDYYNCAFIKAMPVDSIEYYKQEKGILLAQKYNKIYKNNTNKKGIKKSKLIDERYCLKLKESQINIDDLMRERLRRMIEIAILRGHDAIVIGCFGCDMNYGNDINKMANIFAELISNSYYNCFRSVTITCLEDKNYDQKYQEWRGYIYCNLL